jgi:pimeloyl-ACP methyl ester carboxylesterase
VLLHGAPFTSLGFVRLIRELARHHRVIAPDLPGFGYSQASPDFVGSLASYADFVEEFCRALGLRTFFLNLNDASGCFGLVAPARVGQLLDTLPETPENLAERAAVRALIMNHLARMGDVENRVLATAIAPVLMKDKRARQMVFTSHNANLVVLVMQSQ